MSKPFKTILIMIGAAVLLLCAVLGILFLRSKNPDWTACGEADSKYPCAWRRTDEGLIFRISGELPKDSAWQITSTEAVQIAELADKKAEKQSEKDKKKNKNSEKRENGKKQGQYTEFLLTGSFLEPEHAGFVLQDAAQQPLYLINITLAADEKGVSEVQECSAREISATMKVDGENPYTVSGRLDGSLLFRLEKSNAEDWSVSQKKGLLKLQRIIDPENPDGISYLIIGTTPGDTDTLLLYHIGEDIYAEEASAIRLDVAVQPDGSTVLTGHGTETVSLKELSGEADMSIEMEDLFLIARSFAADQLLTGEDARQETEDIYREIPQFTALPEEARVDFYAGVSDGASGEVRTVRFAMNGGLWWLFSADTLSEQQLIDLVDGTGATYEKTKLGETAVQYRTGESRNCFCWTGKQTMLLYNQEESVLLDNCTQDELQRAAEIASVTVEELLDRQEYWPCADEDTAFETARAVCEAAR